MSTNLSTLTRIPSIFTRHCSTLQQRLTEPAASILEPEHRRRARLLSALLVPLIPLGFLGSILIPSLREADFNFWINRAAQVGILASILLGWAYVLSRTD